MMRLLVATTNRHKLREIRHILSDVPVSLHGLDEVPSIPEPDETGTTFAENARLKALYYHQAMRATAPAGPACDLTVAEDSGLSIDALGGAPGVHSARFLGPGARYSERFTEILRRLQETTAPRTARFMCAVAVVEAGTVVFETTGTIEGEIADGPRGEEGFGYDPIFYFPAYGVTLAEVDQTAKLRVAHRGQAFRLVADWLHSKKRRT